MAKSWDILRNKIIKMGEKRGFKADLSRKMGINQTRLGAYLVGLRIPRMDQLDKFAAALNIEPWDLITPEDIINKEPEQGPTVASLLNIIEVQDLSIKQFKAQIDSALQQLTLAIEALRAENKDK